MSNTNTYVGNGVVSPALLENKAKIVKSLRELDATIVEPPPVQSLIDKALAEYKKQIADLHKNRKAIEDASRNLEALKKELASVKKVVAQRAQLRNVPPNYETAHIKRLEGLINESAAVVPIDDTAIHAPFEHKIRAEWETSMKQYKMMCKERKRLEKLLVMVNREIEIDQWKPAYMLFAEHYLDETDVSDDIDDLIMKCNNYFMNSYYDCVFDCDCGCEPSHDSDLQYIPHTYASGDKRCSWGTKMILQFSEPNKIGLIGDANPRVYAERY